MRGWDKSRLADKGRSAIERSPHRRNPDLTALPDRSDVIAALDAVPDPKSGQGLVAAGRVQGLVVTDDRAGFVIEVPAADAALYAPVRDAAEAALKALPGMAKVSVILTAEAVAAAPRRASLSPQAVDQTRPTAPFPPARPAHVPPVLAGPRGPPAPPAALPPGGGPPPPQPPPLLPRAHHLP